VTSRSEPEGLDLLVLNAHEALDEGVVMGDGDHVLHVNDAACRLYGRRSEDLLAARSLFGFLAIGEQERIQKLVTERMAIGEQLPKRFETVIAWPDGTELHVEMSTIAMVQPGAVRTLTLIRDIGERRRHQAELERLALYDPLTGLPNRRLLMDRLERIAARATRERVMAAVFLLDLDGFKRVNDVYGHDAGDQVLVATARALRTSLRNGDTAARLGGDEFVVLSEQIADDMAAGRLARRLGEIIARPIRLVDGTGVSMRASIGIRRFGEEAADPDEILRSADASMYRAKTSARACRPAVPSPFSSPESRPRRRRARRA